MKTYFDKNCNNCSKIANVNRYHEYLLSSLAHEVRNPLTLIYSSLQLLEKDYPAVTDQFLWNQIKEDVQDTICLLKDISKPDALNSYIQQIRVTPVLEKTAMSCRSFMKEQNVTLTADIEEDLPALYGSEIKLKEAVLNLLLNACDAAARADDAVQKPSQTAIVHLSAHLQDQAVIIHVRDNGPGISSSDRNHILEPYVTHKASGTGIGLSVVQSVANQFHGTLTLDTCCDGQNSYTDFCLRLPVQQ